MLHFSCFCPDRSYTKQIQNLGVFCLLWNPKPFLVSFQKGNGEREVWLWGLTVRKRDPFRVRLNNEDLCSAQGLEVLVPRRRVGPAVWAPAHQECPFLRCQITAGAVKAYLIGHSVETEVEQRRVGDACVFIFYCWATDHHQLRDFRTTQISHLIFQEVRSLGRTWLTSLLRVSQV